MTSLERQLASQFGAEIRARGDELLECVAFVPGWDGDFPCDATVQDGAVPHEVCVDPDEVAAGWCTCPEFAVAGPCTHMWATLRAAELVTARPELLESLERTTEPSPDNTTTAVPSSPDVQALNPRLDTLRRRARHGPEREISPLASAIREVHFLLATDPKAGSSAGFSTEDDSVCVLYPAVRRRSQGAAAESSWGAPESATRDDEDGKSGGPTKSGSAQRRLGWLDRFVTNPFDEFPCARLPSHEATAFVEDTAAAGLLFTIPGRSPRANTDPEQIRPVRLDTTTRVTVELELLDVHDRAVSLHPRLTDHTGTELDATKVQAVIGSFLLVDNTLLGWQSAASAEVVGDLLRRGPIVVDRSRTQDLREIVADATVHPPTAVAPRPKIQLDPDSLAVGGPGDSERPDSSAAPRHRGRQSVVPATLEFEYRSADERESGIVAADSKTAFVEIGSGVSKRRHERAYPEERAAVDTFLASGGSIAAPTADHPRPELSLPTHNAADRVRSLLVAGFDVTAGTEPIRLAASPKLRVASGIDWFELEATVESLDGKAVTVPGLLQPGAADGKRPESELVRLASGDVVVIDTRSQDLDAIRAIGKPQPNGTLQIPREQAFVLDGLLQERQGEVELDSTFRTIREQAARGLAPVAQDPRPQFLATLRPYQRESLGWFDFLRSLGVGGCLADDMGLGKTVQVLALLDQQRGQTELPHAPSLVVAPRSLLFHWEREAHKFAPELRVLVFAGAGRSDRHGAAVEAAFGELDLVLTTYGTLRNDIEHMAEVEWNYLILDEAHAIKNENSQASRAVRACRARHRLALSGTPVENHLGELWSLFEFLNPGMLGASRTFRRLVRDGAVRTPMLARQGDESAEEPETETEATANFAQHLRAAVRPFLLRRTKEQVLDELPPKTVQVLDCELSSTQRKAYDELAAHYRARLLGRIDEGAIPDTMRFQVLEALLRLRQAACHPALVDATRSEEDCGKFDVLLPMLEDLREQGHKALLFSQFPSFLTLLRGRLDERGMQHAYLDGSTTDRGGECDRFEQDPDCGLFLISIKAGGHGLNLTAASYVFLLDPWWNPAVEAQAIDRAHRMGQQRKVHAYRLICRDSVEERVAQLQERKRKIAAAVLGDDRSVIQDLQAADVALLLT